VLARLVTPATIAPEALVSRARTGTPGTALPAKPKVVPAPSPGRPAPQRLSYTALGQYAKCPYRFYLERSLRLPPIRPPFPPDVPAEAVSALDPRVRGVIAHRLLEQLDFARPEAPAPEAVLALAEESGAELAPEDVEDIRAIVAAFGASPLCARIAAAASVRREAGFSFPLDPAGGALVNGFVDVLVRGADRRVLVVDYKSDRLGDAEPEDVVARDYATQRIVYALAALRDGAPEVEVAYAFLERPDAPVSATFTSRDVPALAEQLTNLAEGVLEGRHPVAAESGAELAEEQIEDIRAIVAAFGASPLCARIAASDSGDEASGRGRGGVRREASFSFPLDPAGGALVTGVVDVLARAPDGTVLVVDYKSDRLGGAEPAEVVERDYATQRIVYALAALRDGAPAVEVAYAFLERPDAPVSATFTARDAPALAERLTNLAEGVLQGAHPVAAEPHRALCGDCAGRATLCSWPESMTLREAA